MAHRRDSEDTLDEAQALVVRRVRRLMIVSSLIMVGGVILVLGVIVHRLLSDREPIASAEAKFSLPAGARVVSTTIGDGNLVVTFETGEAVEVRLFDLKTLKPGGRLILSPGR